MTDYQDVYKNSYALAIGINTYSDPRFAPLGQAEQDAKNFAEMIKAPPYNFDVTLLLGREATKDAIETALFQLRATQSDDRILVYFAGHGYTLVDEFGQEAGYLAAADTVPEKDYTALELEGVTGLSRRAKAKHIAFIFDACFSGQALGLTRASTDITSDKFLQRRAFQVISAGAGDQTVSDARSMTGVLIEGLRSGVADEDGLVTLSEIGLYLQTTIAADSGRTQIPQFGHLRGSQGGEFVFYQDTSTRLPTDLVSALASTRDSIREGGVEALLQLTQSDNPEMVKLAKKRLDEIARTDPSTKVRAAALGLPTGIPAGEDTVRRVPGKSAPAFADIATPPSSPPVVVGVTPPPPSAHPQPRKPARAKKGGMLAGISTPVLIGGVGAAVLLTIGVVVCLLTVIRPPKPPVTQTPDVTATEPPMTVDITDEPTAPVDEQAGIKAKIIDVLNLAYSLKQTTLHDLTTDGLNQAYTDQALQDRRNAVAIAKKDHCYWDVHLVQPDDLEFQYIGEDAALVRALRVEARAHYCNGVVDEENTFTADRFYITFFMVLKSDKWLVSNYETKNLPD